jgi:uncharacterized protein (DUF1778 family)
MAAATEQQPTKDRYLTVRTTGPARDQLRKAAADRGLTVTALVWQALVDAGVVLTPYGEVETT